MNSTPIDGAGRDVRVVEKPPPGADSGPLLLTPDEVAAVLRTTRKAVYAMAERGLLPGAIRVGRRLLVHRGDLLRWLEDKRTPSPGRTRR